MRLMILASAAALAVAACGTDEQQNDAQAPAAEPAAGERAAAGNDVEQVQPVDDPAKADPADGSSAAASGAETGMAWVFSRAAGRPKLAYGVPQTDNVRLMLRCPEPGEALISFIRPDEVAEDKPGTLTIASANAQRTLTVQTQRGPLGVSVEAEAPTSAAPLQQFRTGQNLQVRWGEETVRVPGEEGDPVRQFFEACD